MTAPVLTPDQLKGMRSIARIIRAAQVAGIEWEAAIAFLSAYAAEEAAARQPIVATTSAPSSTVQ